MTRIEDLNLVREDELALKRVVGALGDRLEENCIGLYELLREKSLAGDNRVLLRKEDMQSSLVIPELKTEAEKLRCGVQAYIGIFERVRDGWKVMDSAGKEIDVYRFYSALPAK